MAAIVSSTCVSLLLISQSNNLLDALALFEIVLQCQRRRHGHLHPDVASALHNVGIVHLRSQNHDEALKAFEEAARIRKGALGRDHPQVAVSYNRRSSLHYYSIRRNANLISFVLIRRSHS